MDVTTNNHVQYTQNHLLHGLLDDLLIYVFNFLQIKSLIQLKLTSKYLNKIINDNNQSYHYLHMQTLETIFSKSDDNHKYKLLECFKSIKSLETVINLNRIFPISELKQNDEYKKSKLFQELPPKIFYENFITQFLSQLHKLEGLIVNGCFDDVAIKLPFQPRLKSMTIRNTESSSLISSFFHALLASQFNINTNNQLKKDKNQINNAWCKILNKAGYHTLYSLKVYDFVASRKTLFNLSRFENLSSLQIQYDSIDYNSNKDLMDCNDDLAEEIEFLISKISMITDRDMELFVCLLFKNILCLKNVSISGEESANNFDCDMNSLSLLMLYYLLYFHGHNLHSLNVRICMDNQLKYQYHHEIMQIYHKIIQYPFQFNVKCFNSCSITLLTPYDENNNVDTVNFNVDKENDCDMDDIIIKYGNASKLMEYISMLPLTIQTFVSLFDRFKCCLNECYMDNIDNEEKYHINDFNVTLESAAGYKHYGYYYGFMIAKGIYSFHPRVVNITPSLLELDINDSELFINTLQSIAKWLGLFVANKCKVKKELKLIETLKISVSCIAQISVKDLSEFCVGDGNDERLITTLQLFAKDLCVRNIYLNIETMCPSDDTDKLRYYIRMQKHVKSIGFKIDLKPKDNSQSLEISYNAK